MAVVVQDWQCGKSLSQCNRHMLDSGLFSDVTFHVGFPGGEKQTIPAHRAFLVSRSPVFEAMFCGELAGKSGAMVKVEDVEPEIFRDLLIYQYTDDVVLTKDNALHLFYAAKKYMLPSLVAKCSTFLEANIGSDTVCTILTHAHIFQHKELETKCEKYMQENTQAVLASDDFLNLSQETLCLILSFDIFNVRSELDAFRSCVRWSEEKLKKEGTKVSDSNIRETMGPALYLIRFPTADMGEFAEVCGTSNILSDHEKSEIYRYGLTKKGETAGSVAGFSTLPRRSDPVCVTRFEECTDDPPWNCFGDIDAICFSVDRPGDLEGVFLYGTTCPSSFSTVKVEIYEQISEKRVHVTKLSHIPCSGDNKPIPVMLRQPLRLSSGLTYDLAVTLKCPETFNGQEGNAVICAPGCKFTFSDSDRSYNDTNVYGGQIPGLMFRRV